MRKARTVMTDEMRSEIVRMRSEGMYLNVIAKQLGISKGAVENTLRLYREDGISLEEATETHKEVMREKHASEVPWMEHITPLHQHKQALESRVRACEESLQKARQEYRNFLATVGQLMQESEEND